MAFFQFPSISICALNSPTHSVRFPLETFLGGFVVLGGVGVWWFNIIIKLNFYDQDVVSLTSDQVVIKRLLLG